MLRHDERLAEVFLSSRADLRTAFAEARVTRRATALFLFAESIVLYDPDTMSRYFAGKMPSSARGYSTDI
ncbi:hypothetical protein [Streptomyces sporangiiformans]|uniref:hypothetical protein n=1 Tax=Streptomyces sporangiiformans TaxID=2315329 RepID=UPI001F098B23|nr:hypothetical protein [Streptomyces sporangiiformans]